MRGCQGCIAIMRRWVTLLSLLFAAVRRSVVTRHVETSERPGRESLRSSATMPGNAKFWENKWCVQPCRPAAITHCAQRQKSFFEAASEIASTQKSILNLCRIHQTARFHLAWLTICVACGGPHGIPRRHGDFGQSS